MRFSFCIPTKNEEKLLPRLLEQLSKLEIDHEVIVSDSGSIDHTKEIARRYGASVIESNDEKDNIAIGRNRAAKIAAGEILIFMNADVKIADLHTFSEYLEHFQFKNQSAAAAVNVLVEPGEETILDKIFLNFYNNWFFLLNYWGLGMGRGECHIIRKNIFEKFGGYKENLVAGEDFELFRRIRKSADIDWAKSVVVYESPRRYRYYGHFKIMLSWFVNSFYMIFFNRSKSVEWKAIR